MAIIDKTTNLSFPKFVSLLRRYIEQNDYRLQKEKKTNMLQFIIENFFFTSQPGYSTNQSRAVKYRLKHNGKARRKV